MPDGASASRIPPARAFAIDRLNRLAADALQLPARQWSEAGQSREGGILFTWKTRPQERHFGAERERNEGIRLLPLEMVGTPART